MISEVLKGRNTLAFGAAEDNDDDPRLLEGIGDRSDCVGMLLLLSWILVDVVLTMVWVRINGILGVNKEKKRKEYLGRRLSPKSDPWIQINPRNWGSCWLHAKHMTA